MHVAVYVESKNVCKRNFTGMNRAGVKSDRDPCKQRGRNWEKIGPKSDRNRRFSENDVNTAKTTCKYAVRNYIYIYVVYIYIMGSRMVRLNHGVIAV